MASVGRGRRCESPRWDLLGGGMEGARAIPGLERLRLALGQLCLLTVAIDSGLSPCPVSSYCSIRLSGISVCPMHDACIVPCFMQAKCVDSDNDKARQGKATKDKPAQTGINSPPKADSLKPRYCTADGMVDDSNSLSVPAIPPISR